MKKKERYTWVARISKMGRILYIAVPRVIPLRHGQRVRVTVEVEQTQ